MVARWNVIVQHPVASNKKLHPSKEAADDVPGITGRQGCERTPNLGHVNDTANCASGLLYQAVGLCKVRQGLGSKRDPVRDFRGIAPIELQCQCQAVARTQHMRTPYV